MLERLNRPRHFVQQQLHGLDDIAVFSQQVTALARQLALPQPPELKVQKSPNCYSVLVRDPWISNAKPVLGVVYVHNGPAPGIAEMAWDMNIGLLEEHVGRYVRYLDNLSGGATEPGSLTINGRMLQILDAKPHAANYTQREWAAHLGCDISAVLQADTWAYLSVKREQSQQLETLKAWAEANLKGKQLRLVTELVTRENSSMPICDFAVLPGIDWELPYDGAFNSLRTTLNRKLKAIHYRIERRNNAACLIKLAQK